MPATWSFSNILSASDGSVSLMFSAALFIWGIAGVLAMISKLSIEDLWDSLPDKLEKRWESVWLIFGVSKELSLNMIAVFSKIFLAKVSTISLLTWKESLFQLI